MLVEEVLDVVDTVLVVDGVGMVVVVVQVSTGAWTQVCPAASQLSVVHGSPSSQLRGVPSRQMPPRQASFTVQKEPSSHGVVSGFAGCVQALPAQTSSVHGLPSSVHDPVRGVKTQPLVGLHVSMVHSLPSLQMRGLPGWQVAAASQVSPTVHWLLSLHGVPGAAGVCGWQPPTGSQMSRVQGLPSLQLSGRPKRQIPAPHFSSPLQTLPSEQGMPSATGSWRQPSPGSHESVVHTFASLHEGSSTWQKREQPSQLCSAPAVSQVSGNSTTPLPQVGHGTRHPDKMVLVQVGSAVTVGAGVTVPLIERGLRLGCVSMFEPSVAPTAPGVVVVASSGPWIVSCSRAARALLPAAGPPARRLPAAVTVTSHPLRSVKPPAPQPRSRLQPPPPTSIVFWTERFPLPCRPASTITPPPYPARARPLASTGPLRVTSRPALISGKPPPKPPDASRIPPLTTSKNASSDRSPPQPMAPLARADTMVADATLIEPREMKSSSPPPPSGTLPSARMLAATVRSP